MTIEILDFDKKNKSKKDHEHSRLSRQYKITLNWKSPEYFVPLQNLTLDLNRYINSVCLNLFYAHRTAKVINLSTDTICRSRACSVS